MITLEKWLLFLALKKQVGFFDLSLLCKGMCLFSFFLCHYTEQSCQIGEGRHRKPCEIAKHRCSMCSLQTGPDL